MRLIAKLLGMIGCVAAIGLSADPLGAQSRVIPALEDSWIHGLGSNSTSGGVGNDLAICPTADYWIYLKFDVAGVPGPILNVELRLTRFAGGRPEEISLYSVFDDTWSESTLNGPNRPEPRAPSPEETIAVGSEGQNYDRWTSPALTDWVRQEVAGDGTLSLMLREDPDDQLDVRRFYSREGAPSSDEVPYLVICSGTDRLNETVDAGWQAEAVGCGDKPSFDFDSNGGWHVMGMTERINASVVWYASAASIDGPWFPRVLSEGWFYGPGGMRVAPDGMAHIAWHEHNLEEPIHLSVRPDGSFTERLIVSAGHNGWDNSLAIDGNGELHQASIFPSTFQATESLEYGYFDGEDWTYEQVPGSGMIMYGFSTSIAVDGEGKPHIVACRARDWLASGDLIYAVKESTGWTVSEILTGGIRGRFPSLYFDHWFRPHVAWMDIDETDTSQALIRYAVLNNMAWEMETVDTISNVELSAAEARKSVSLVLDSESRPHIAYASKREIRYAHKPLGDWLRTTVLESDRDVYKGLVVLRLAPDGTPGMVFWEVSSFQGGGLVRLAQAVPPGPGEQLPGDCNQDGSLDISDGLCLFGFLFGGNPSRLPCGSGSRDDAGNVSLLDINGDDSIDVSDPISLLLYLFAGGPAPASGVECLPLEGCPEVCVSKG